MKTFLLVWLCALNAFGAILEWDAVTNNVDGSLATDLAGYRVFVGPAPRTYVKTYVTTNTILAVTNSTLSTGTNYFAVTAFNTGGLESEYSDEVFYLKPKVAPGAPQRLRISGTNAVNTIKLLQSTGVGGWTETGQVFVPISSDPTTFYQAAAPARDIIPPTFPSPSPFSTPGGPTSTAVISPPLRSPPMTVPVPLQIPTSPSGVRRITVTIDLQ